MKNATQVSFLSSCSHWDTFYTKADLQKLFDSGISHIRIPVGYWMVDVQEGEPFPAPPASDADGMRFYLKRLVGWCQEIGLKFLLDLHGCPGSQNGFDNSGRRGDILWFQVRHGTGVDKLRSRFTTEKLRQFYVVRMYIRTH